MMSLMYYIACGLNTFKVMIIIDDIGFWFYQYVVLSKANMWKRDIEIMWR